MHLDKGKTFLTNKKLRLNPFYDRHATALSLPALGSEIYDPTDASNKLGPNET